MARYPTFGVHPGVRRYPTPMLLKLRHQIDAPEDFFS
jgi:hypothetical protein